MISPLRDGITSTQARGYLLKGGLIREFTHLIQHADTARLPVASVYNKVDLFGPAVVSRGTIERTGPGHHVALHVSALMGDGIDELGQWLLEVAGWQPGMEGVFLARERHIRALDEATGHVTAASQYAGQYEIFAEELRLAQLALSRITGEFTPDDLLGEIFSRFCIGK